MNLIKSNFTRAAFFATAVLAFGACDTTQGQMLGSDQLNVPATAASGGSSSGGGDKSAGGGNGTETKAALGNSCHTGDTSKYCLAVKYVVFKNSSDAPAISQAEVQANMDSMNQIWDKCGIAFQVDQFEEVSPSASNVPASPSAMGELDTIRSAFSDDTTLLVATTVGTWGLSANAWTSMPGSAPYGAIIEGSVGNYGPIIAHEIGHYLGLDHVQDQSELMNPVIYSTSTGITPAECDTARAQAGGIWAKMQR